MLGSGVRTVGVLHAVVGDVHGQLDALRRLEDRVAAHAARHGLQPLVISVGDLVDRGPDSSGVVRHVARGVAAGTHVAVMGNHESMFLAVVRAVAPDLMSDAGDPWPPDTPTFEELWERKLGNASRWLPLDDYVRFQTLSWLVQGGATTLASYGAIDVADPSTWRVDPEDLRFLADLPVIWRAEGVVVTHALLGKEAMVALGSEDAAVRERAREVAMWGRTPPKNRMDDDRVHVSGHTPLSAVRRRPQIGVVQCDTGAGFGRRLSAWCVETDRVLSVGI
ncbi:MAG: metallophosphoesterase [Alphaproteobacteria bacterium]|nr:metallophosphoesterase [Alphaproteobacteria bacterium]